MMKSNPGAELNQKIVKSRSMVAYSTEKVGKTIDGLTSAGLKRVLRIMSHTHFADAILNRPTNTELHEVEQKLIDNIYALHETLFGHQALLQEAKKTIESKSGIETVDISTSLKENKSEKRVE